MMALHSALEGFFVLRCGIQVPSKRKRSCCVIASSLMKTLLLQQIQAVLQCTNTHTQRLTHSRTLYILRRTSRVVPTYAAPSGSTLFPPSIVRSGAPMVNWVHTEDSSEPAAPSCSHIVLVPCNSAVQYAKICSRETGSVTVGEGGRDGEQSAQLESLYAT